VTKAEAKEFWAPIINDFQPLDSAWLGEMDKFYINLVLPIARNKRRGENSDYKCEAGYVALRNLIAAGDPGLGGAS